MADDPQNMPTPPSTSDGALNFFLGQLTERVGNIAREVANLLGPRLSNMERRLEKLENWRNWMTGLGAGFSLLSLLVAAVALYKAFN